ncbi:cysteine desulfurase [Microcystis phage MaAM05]|nr:cysteine desulfurase [Microcystis phage MaAM05]
MHYLDNAATSWPKPEAVYSVMDQSFRSLFSPKRGTAKAARLGASQLQAARQTLADLFNVSNPERISFTSGATHALNLAIQAYPWQAGDGIIISAVEHHALSRPVRKMAREKGIQFFVVPYTDAIPFDLAAYEALLKNHPEIKMVATTHASNVIGSVLPVAEIGRLAHQYGKLYLVDAAQSAGVLPVDVQAQHIDMLAVPGHKSLYGPPGVGALYLSEAVQLNTFMEGGTGNDSGKHAMRATPPDSIEVGTIPLPQILAMAEGARWVQEVGLSTIHSHEMTLLAQLLSGLQEIPEVTLYGHTDIAHKTPVVSFNVMGQEPKVLGERLFEQYGIALRAGFHCAPMAHEAIGSIHRGGTVRASIGYYTQPEDVAALVNALKKLLSESLSQV